MVEQLLRDCYILIVEDEHRLAHDVRDGLTDAGAIVIGPVATLEAALKRIRAEQNIDGAILDIDLCGVKAFPAADLLMEREVPFIFTTGYDDRSIPARFDHVPRCEKPYSLSKLEHAIVEAIAPEAGESDLAS